MSRKEIGVEKHTIESEEREERRTYGGEKNLRKLSLFTNLSTWIYGQVYHGPESMKEEECRESILQTNSP